MILLTLCLGVYASWEAFSYYPALHVEGVFESFLIHASIALFAFIGAMTLINNVFGGYYISLLAWLGELVSSIHISEDQISNNYFISVSGVISVFAIGALLYDIAHALFNKNT